MSKSMPIPGLTADPKIVKELAGILADAYEAYADKAAESGTPLSYIDGFMAAHNFHKAIVQHLEEVAPAGIPGVWANMALATFADSLIDKDQDD